MIVDEFDFGDGVLDQVLRLEGIVVVLSIVRVVMFHAFQEALASGFQQFEWLSLPTITEQLMRTLMFSSVSLDLI